MTRSTIIAALLLSLVCVLSLQGADGNASKDAFVLPGDVILPQIATGGDGAQGFFMTFQSVNITNAAASVQISFFDSTGNPMVLDFVEDGTPVTASFLSKTLGAKGSSFARTFPMGATQVGYARVQSTPPNSIAVSATFNQAVTDRPLFQSFIPLSSGVQDRFLVPVLNSGVSTGSVAIVSLVSQQVTLTARDTNGVALCSGTRMFAAGEHAAFVVSSLAALSCTANVDSILEVQGPEKALSGVGITAQDSGAFSTQPVYGPVPAP